MGVKVLICIGCIMYMNAVYGQYYDANAKNTGSSKKAPKPKSNFWQNVYPGGNIGLGLGRYHAYVEVSPLAGYWITNRITAGLQLSYIYMYYQFTSFKYAKTFEYRTNIYGASPFVRVFPLDWLFIHAEYGLYSGDLIMDTGTTYINDRQWRAFPMAGGGFIFRFGKRSGLMISLLYNFNYDTAFPIYGNPWSIRVGFIL
ncbi:MAG: hypothetical protein NW207_12805 [Cytophagales bacterium]|nr:hypothetical protein [Cytophagales bacterium]